MHVADFLPSSERFFNHHNFSLVKCFIAETRVFFNEVRIFMRSLLLIISVQRNIAISNFLVRDTKSLMAFDGLRVLIVNH